jgi:multicomponent K+:H+ antiporter subunit A
MSAVAVAGGVALYFGLQRFINLHRLVRAARLGEHWRARPVRMMGTQAALSAARALVDALQNGSLQRYLRCWW